MLQSCWLKCWLIWALSHNRYLLFLSLLTPEDYRQTFLCTRLKHWSRAKKARLVWLRKLQDVRQITCLKQQRSLSFIFCKTQRSYEKIMCICYFIGSVVKIVLEATSGGVLYKKFTELPGNCKCQSLFFNEFAGAAMSLLTFLTWKSLNIVYRKVMKFFKVLPKKNLKSACNRYVLQQKQPSEVFYEKRCSYEACNFIKKETLAQVLSCEFCKISKNTFFTEHLWTTTLVATVMKACNFIKKRDFSTGVFLWIFQNFWNTFFYRTTVVAAFELCFSVRKNSQQRTLVDRFN